MKMPRCSVTQYLGIFTYFVCLICDIELVSYAPNGLKRPLVRNSFELLAQSFYVNVNRSRVSEIIKSPYFVEQLIACENTIAI